MGTDGPSADASESITDARNPDALAPDAGASVCDPSAPGTGLATLTAPSFTVAISKPTPVFRTLTDHGRQHYPDSAITFRESGSGWEVYVPSGRESYRLLGSSPTTVSMNPTEEILGPTGDTADPHQGYAGISSVLECGGELVGFFHAEYHAIPVTPWADCPAPYHASMARAVSSTGGASFVAGSPAWFLNSSGVAVYGQPKCAYGAGGGSIFDPGGAYLYLYYYDWDAANGIYLARACRDECGLPGTWRKYDAGSFSSAAFASDFLQPSGPSTVLVAAAGNAFDAFPVVSRNSYLDSYLMVVATEAGFAVRASADGLTWGPRVALLRHLEAADDRIPVLYPTLVDAQTWSRNQTGRQLKLVYAAMTDDQGQRATHRAFIADVELTRAGDTQTASYDRRLLARYYRTTAPADHWVTTSSSTGYPFEANLGLLAANSISGTRPLYDCVLGADHMVSARSDCEGGVSLGIMGYAWETDDSSRHAIYRCYMTPGGVTDHFVSIDAGCEGLTAEGPLGYVE